jgi:hypothetical protein
MSPWLSVMLLGVAIFGFAWLSPRRGTEDNAEGGSDPAYDRLLEDLETENRELVDAVAKFKQEQDDTVGRLVKQIVELERQMKWLAEQSAASAAVAAAAFIPAPSASPQMQQNAATAPAEPAAPAAPADIPVPEVTVPDEAIQAPASIRVRYAELLALHNKGRSVEQIAKSVGMHKGEVQLILQLARREDDQHA